MYCLSAGLLACYCRRKTREPFLNAMKISCNDKWRVVVFLSFFLRCLCGRVMFLCFHPCLVPVYLLQVVHPSLQAVKFCRNFKPYSVVFLGGWVGEGKGVEARKVNNKQTMATFPPPKLPDNSVQCVCYLRVLLLSQNSTC